IYPTVEKELLNYVQIKWAERMTVTASMIGRKVRKLGKTLDIQDAKFSSGWVKHFMRQNKLVERVRTQHVQKLPEDIPLVVKEFLQTSHEKTKDIEKKFIISFDEIPIRCGDHGTLCKYDRRFDDLDLYSTSYSGQTEWEGLDVLEIPGGTTCVSQLPDVSVNKPFKNGKGGFTKKGNRKRASYELVCEWVSETWREISTDLLARSFEAAGLTLNPNGSENDKMTGHLRAIIANHMNEVCFSVEEDNELSNQDDVDNESNPDDEFGDELYSESATDDDSVDMMNIE
ncbi:7418_t:CDS:2, partial [Dentiscutata erythropus]